jgi:predicted transcriptional regulator
MPIIDDNGSVIGIITAIDILWAIRVRKDLNTLLVRDLMTQNPSVVNQNTKLKK